MKLSVYDRIQAIIRHPQYLKDYFYILGLKKANPSNYALDPSYTKFINKWKVPYPISIKEVKELQKDAFKYIFGSSPVQMIREWPTKPGDVPIGRGLLSKKPMVSSKRKKGKPRKINVSRLLDTLDFSQDLEEDRYLTLKIDLWAAKEEIIKGVKEKVGLYRKEAKPPKGRIRETQYDPWIVYDMREEGKSYEEIVQTIDPTKNRGTLLARIDVARKACSKARKMITAVAPARPTGN